MKRMILAVSCLAMAALAARSAHAADAPKANAPKGGPNFLFCYTDDQQWAAMSVVQLEMGKAGRFPWFKTPNMDRIAAEGMRFRNAFVEISLCAPSRASFLTGQYSHLNGVANNHTPFPLDNITWASQLRAAGYTTAYFGKFHMGSQSGQRPGFDYSASFVGQGRYMDCPIEVNGKSTPSKGWVDDVTTNYLLDWLKQNKEKPFAAAIGFKSSHGPWEPAERHANDLSDSISKQAPNADAKPPYLAEPTGPGKTRAKKQKKGARGPEFGKTYEVLADADEAEDSGLVTDLAKIKMQRNYFRTLLGVDDNLGRILAYLDEAKLTDNTVLVFTTDNGYYLGEHGLGDKRTAYEEALRIPFLVRYPKIVKPGSLSDQMVLNIDVAPTFLDLAGVKIPSVMQGRSIRPLLAGETPKDWRSAWFYEYFYERGFTQPTVLAVRTADAKLVQYPGHGGWTELFDLKADPHEKNNLYNNSDAAELQKKMEALFKQESEAVHFKIPAYADDPNAAPAKESGKSEKAPAKARSSAGPVLDLNFAEAATGGKVTDASPSKISAEVSHAVPVNGRDGHKAMQFRGDGNIDLGNPDALNPGAGPLMIEAEFCADADGVVLAHGGKSEGYALLVEKGKPVLAVNVATRVTRAQAPVNIIGKWVKVTAKLHGESISIAAEGSEPATAELAAPLSHQPHEGMQIGADTKTQIVDGAKPFSGMIESVKVTAEAAHSKL